MKVDRSGSSLHTGTAAAEGAALGFKILIFPRNNWIDASSHVKAICGAEACETGKPTVYQKHLKQGIEMLREAFSCLAPRTPGYFFFFFRVLPQDGYGKAVKS